MRSIAYIVPTFWTRGSGKKLRGDTDATLLALYLMTAPQSSQLGLYHSSLAQIGNDLGWTADKIRETFQRITEIARYDEDAELVWVPATLRYQVGDEMSIKDYRRAAMERELRLFGSHEFVTEFRDLYAESHGISRSSFPATKGDKNAAGRDDKIKKREGGNGRGKGDPDVLVTGAVTSTTQPLSGAPPSPCPDQTPAPLPPPIPSHSLPDPGLGGAGGSDSAAEFKPADFQPTAEDLAYAKSIGIAQKKVAKVLGRYHAKVTKIQSRAAHSSSFRNYLRAEVKHRSKDDAEEPGENSSYEADEDEKPAEPLELVLYRKYAIDGPADKAERYRQKCIAMGYIKAEN